MYAMNDGYIYIYKRLPAKTETNMPIIVPDFSTERKYLFKEIGTRSDEHFFLKMRDIETVKRVQVLRQKNIAAGDLAEIGGIYYQVGRVWQGANKKGVPVTELTLEEMEAGYDPGRTDRGKI